MNGNYGEPVKVLGEIQVKTASGWEWFGTIANTTAYLLYLNSKFSTDPRYRVVNQHGEVIEHE